MLRTIIALILFLNAATSLFGMDFGLRFNSHSNPPDKRTSVALGNTQYRIGNEFEIGFFFSFYSMPIFGNIASLTTDDGQRISIVASAVDGDDYRLGLVVNDRLSHIKTPLTIDPFKEDHVVLTLNKASNTILLKLNTSEIEGHIDLSGSNNISVVFGADEKVRIPDVSPIDLRNIRVFQDGQNTNHWDFKFHISDTTAIDDIGGVKATVTNPHWLIDDHTDWTLIHSLKTKNRIQSAFNPDKELFYIIDDENISVFSPLTGDSAISKITGGNRIMAYSNHIAYNPNSNILVNYNLNRKSSSIYDFGRNQWIGVNINPKDEPNYSNHAVAISGDTLYAFGGYGFYKYHNDVFTVNLSNGKIDEHKLKPALMPMTSAAASVVDGKLYIFGGKGNDLGRQELLSKYNYALYEYDINTWSGKKIWEIDSVKYDFLPSQTMYYDKEDDCFYFAATRHGGQLMRISRTSPDISIASTEIQSDMNYHDFVFDLYRSKDGIRYYLVLDKRLDPLTHDFNIYMISAPFLNDEYLIHNKILDTNSANRSESSSGILSWYIYASIIFVLAIFVVCFIILRRKHKGGFNGVKPSDSVNVLPLDSTVSEPLQNDGNQINSKSEEEDFTFIASTEVENSTYFNRGKASISFLGGFCVRDKEGNDITVKFTARLKHLLIMLLLTSLKYESGIKYQMIDEEIWSDKDEKSAQNNRNVTMRKLRLILEEVGNVVITYDKGFFRIETNDVMFDYEELKLRIAEIKNSECIGPELVNQLLELLLMGPMLPNTTYEWLDKYKADFSNSALEILIKLLKYELGKDDNLAYRIAETVSLHDTLNEEALFAKCQILSRRKMLGLAKNIHAKFCKDYLKSMGEDYTLSFAEVCKTSL